MRVIFARLPKTVQFVVLDRDTVVVSDEMRITALPYLPLCVAATLAAAGVVQAVGG